MNNSESHREQRIEIFKPFGEAYDLTKKILFQPFDFKKWLVLGFAAFLAFLGSGGFNFNYNTRGNRFERGEWQNIKQGISQIPPWVVVGGLAVLFVTIVAVTILFAWLRARGRFIFIDCVVKNRAAIAEPWREFHTEGNSYFIFSVIVGIGFTFCALILALPFMLPILRHVTFLHLHDIYLIGMIALWAVVIALFVVAWTLIGHVTIMVMYCRRCRVLPALRIATSLIADYPGEITLYCLFWIVLGIATGCIACLAICFTCCIAAIPYVGTVILLPIYVCLRAFGLLFLRQFGPGYDAWANAVAPIESTPPSTPPPPPAPPSPPALPS